MYQTTEKMGVMNDAVQIVSQANAVGVEMLGVKHPDDAMNSPDGADPKGRPGTSDAISIAPSKHPMN